MAPTMALMMLVSLLFLAVIVDYAWLANCRVELNRSAEAAALAAARGLLCDELLLPQSDDEEIASRARLAADRVARSNLAAGQPVALNLDRGDVRIGRHVEQAATGEILFLQSDHRPDYVEVLAARTRSRNNPVALFLSSLSGTTNADVRANAAATFDHDVIAIRPFPGGRVPMLPLAVLQTAASGTGLQSWEQQIEQRTGSDQYSVDPATGRVWSRPDGIPEIILQSASRVIPSERANTHLMEVGGQPGQVNLAQQVHSGWSLDDLAAYGGQIRFNGTPVPIACSDDYDHEIEGAFGDILGQPRLVVLYHTYQAADKQRYASLTADRLVAARLMAIRSAPGGGYEFVLQPTVMSTRTAVLASELAEMANKPLAAGGHTADGHTDNTRPENRYVYKVRLAH